MWRYSLLILCLCLPGYAAGFTIELPRSAVITKTVERGEDIYGLPTGAYAEGRLPVTQVKGRFLQRAWRIAGTALTTVQIIEPQRAALQAEGFEILLDCASRECGGFDFRFATRILPSPAMFVDIFQYRFLSAQHPDGRAVSIFTSIVSDDAYVQIIDVAPAGGKALAVKTVRKEQVTPMQNVDTAPGSVADLLLKNGFVALDDLRFAIGSDDLSEGQYDSLAALAAFLKADPKREILLVGHTDAVGSLASNISLSKRRAASAVARLKSRYQVPANQVEAAGMGFLSPRATNMTPEGREKNRRVVAILRNTE